MLLLISFKREVNNFAIEECFAQQTNQFFSTAPFFYNGMEFLHIGSCLFTMCWQKRIEFDDFCYWLNWTINCIGGQNIRFLELSQRLILLASIIDYDCDGVSKIMVNTYGYKPIYAFNLNSKGRGCESNHSDIKTSTSSSSKGLFFWGRG